MIVDIEGNKYEGAGGPSGTPHNEEVEAFYELMTRSGAGTTLDLVLAQYGLHAELAEDSLGRKSIRLRAGANAFLTAPGNADVVTMLRVRMIETLAYLRRLDELPPAAQVAVVDAAMAAGAAVRLTLEIGEDALGKLSDLQRSALYNGLLLIGAVVGTRDYLDMLLGRSDPDAQEDPADA